MNPKFSTTLLLASLLHFSSGQQVQAYLSSTSYTLATDQIPNSAKGGVHDQDPSIGDNEIRICDQTQFQTGGLGCFLNSVSSEQGDWLEWNIEDNFACSMSIGRNVHARFCQWDDCRDEDYFELVGPMIYNDMSHWCDDVDMVLLKWYDEEAEALVMASTYTNMELGYTNVFDLGRYFDYNLEAMHMGNDDMDCLYVPKGRKVTLYKDGDCTGQVESYVGYHYSGTIELQNEVSCMEVEDMKIDQLAGEWVLIASSLSGEAIDFGYDIQMTYSQEQSHTEVEEIMYSASLNVKFASSSYNHTQEFKDTFSTIMGLDINYHYNLGCPASEEVEAQALYVWRMSGYRPQLDRETYVLANSGLSAYYICRKNELAHTPPDCPAEFCGYDGQCETCLI